MKNEKNAAKRYVIKYNALNIIVTILIFTAVGALALVQNTVLTLLAMVGGLFLWRKIGSYIFYKCIISILYEKLDPETFLAVIREGRFDSYTATMRLSGEYFLGSYRNVLEICKTRLSDEGINTRYRCYYLAFLADVYFDTGDDENLRAVCAQFEELIAAEKENVQKQIRKNYSNITFYKQYLSGNTDACVSFINEPVHTKITAYRRIFFRARLALVEGNTENACKLCEALAREVPSLNFGKLAINKLNEMDNKPTADLLENGDASEEFSPCENQDGKKYGKGKRIISTLSIILFFLLPIIIAGGLLKTEDTTSAYNENIRVLVEEDYDGVKVLDTFMLMDGEETVDSMFICTTDTHIIVGCLYSYEDDDALYYSKMADISISSLSNEGESPWLRFFESVTSDKYIESCFALSKSDIPSDNFHLSRLRVNGKTVYFAVTFIADFSDVSEVKSQ